MALVPDRTTVLIVGAGPAGLTAAHSLLHHGCHDFVIVDAVSRGEIHSRALMVHAATLEAMDSVGCGDDLVPYGMKTTTFNVGTRSGKLFSPHIESLTSYTRYPYILSVPQNVTEHTLEEKLNTLGVKIRRPLKVIGIRPNRDNPHFSDVAFEDGRVISAKYVIGADGARSAVRTLAGIGFSDPAPAEGEADNNLAQIVLADVTFDHNSVDDLASHATLSPDSFFLRFPFPSSYNETLTTDGQVVTSERIYRIACGVPLAEGEIPHSPSKGYLQQLVDRFGPYNLSSDPSVNTNPKPTSIKEVVWSSRFRTRASAADTTFTRLGSGDSGGEGGVVLLIGDAAHIHSPVGGQGMNLGIRDAVFVGEAVANHINASKTQPLSEADMILREFAMTRHARALEVIKLTKTILSVVGMKHRAQFSWWLPIDSTIIRTWGLWVLGNIPFVRNRMAYQLSGLSRR